MSIVIVIGNKMKALKSLRVQAADGVRPPYEREGEVVVRSGRLSVFRLPTGIEIGGLVVILAVATPDALHATAPSATSAGYGSIIYLAAIAGITLFSESSNAWLIAGILLTIVGVIQIGRPSGEEEVMEAV